MDLQSFIQSGLLESYVLGQCTRSERSLVERMLAQYPEARAEMSAIEEALEAYAQSQAINPPSGLKAIILDAVEREANPRKAPPVALLRAFQLAALGLLVAAAFFFFQKNKENAEKEVLQKQIAALEVQLSNCAESKAIVDVLSHPDTKSIKMTDSQKAPKVSTYVFNNETKCKVELAVSGMPAPPERRYFQMWALVKDEKPRSMGMVDLQSPGGVQTFDCVPNAIGFAVSAEESPKGNPEPTLLIMSGSVLPVKQG